jgi:GNAT superfamily N-acetyltransferase
MVFADTLLARRIEGAEAAIARGCAGAGAAWAEFAGGCAVFQGIDSPLTQVVGIGLNGPTPEPEVDALETFFRSRGARVRLDLCPLADPALLESLGARGYRPAEFNIVLARRLPGPAETPAPRALRIGAGQEDVWAATVGRGFFGEFPLTPDEMEVGRAIAAMPGVECYLAWEDGEPAAGGALTVHGGLATLFADSARDAYRRRGLHRELIAARLNEAMAKGCDMATASTLPGSPSQRNYERLGFEVVYTKITLIR